MQLYPGLKFVSNAAAYGEEHCVYSQDRFLDECERVPALVTVDLPLKAAGVSTKNMQSMLFHIFVPIKTHNTLSDFANMCIPRFILYSLYSFFCP